MQISVTKCILKHYVLLAILDKCADYINQHSHETISSQF